MSRRQHWGLAGGCAAASVPGSERRAVAAQPVSALRSSCRGKRRCFHRTDPLRWEPRRGALAARWARAARSHMHPLPRADPRRSAPAGPRRAPGATHNAITIYRGSDLFYISCWYRSSRLSHAAGRGAGAVGGCPWDTSLPAARCCWRSPERSPTASRGRARNRGSRPPLPRWFGSGNCWVAERGGEGRAPSSAVPVTPGCGR